MTQPICPQCHADLDDDLVASTGSAECPFCGADLAGVDFGENSRKSVSASAVAGNHPATSHGRPAGSEIEIVESTRDRLVIHIPPGGKRARGIGCFAILWNGIVTVFTVVGVFAVGQGNNDHPPLIFAIPFLGIFWLVGLGMAYWWVRMRFMRLYLLIDPSRVAIQRTLFGRKSLKETHLGPKPFAELVESYQENDVSVYAVAIEGTDRTAKFGTPLSREEKDWLVDTINTFFGNETASQTGIGEDADGNETDFADSLGTPIEPISPDRISPESGIKILDSDAERLRFQLAAFPKHPIRYVIGGILLVFGFGWIAGTTAMFFAQLGDGLGGFDIFPIIMGIFFAIAGIVPMFLAIAVLHGGTVTVDLTRDQLHARWHLGPFGISKKAAAGSISRVAIQAGIQVQNYNGRRGRSSDTSSSGKVCMVQAAGKDIPLTSYHDMAVAREVGGIILYQLDRMGIGLHA